MQLSKEEYARKRIHNGSSVQIENSVTQVTTRRVKPNSYPRENNFSQHLTTIKDSCMFLKYKLTGFVDLIDYNLSVSIFY